MKHNDPQLADTIKEFNKILQKLEKASKTCEELLSIYKITNKNKEVSYPLRNI
jgi:hypothetical protein